MTLYPHSSDWASQFGMKFLDDCEVIVVIWLSRWTMVFSCHEANSVDSDASIH